MKDVTILEPSDVTAAIEHYDTTTVVPLELQLAELTARVAALENVQPPTYPSGAPITTDIPAGWRETVREHFTVDCTEGGFAAAYGARGIKFYPRGYYDTRRKQGRGGGEYSADYISVAGSICTQRMFVNPSGVTQCSALVPTAQPGNGKWGDAPGMIIEQRSRFTYTDGLKSAHLLWPQSDKSLPDGEIDVVEFEGPTTPPPPEPPPTVDVFVHHQGATSGGDQKRIPTTVDPRQWHTYRAVWVMGKSVTIYCDGVLVAGTDNPYSTRIPATPMHCVLQNESWLATAPVPATAKGTIETDWIRVLVPT